MGPVQVEHEAGSGVEIPGIIHGNVNPLGVTTVKIVLAIQDLEDLSVIFVAADLVTEGIAITPWLRGVITLAQDLRVLVLGDLV